MYVGNAFDTNELLDAGVHNARYAFVCTGSQDENLSVARKIFEITRERRNPDNTDPLKVYIAISGDLRDHSFGGQILDSISVPHEKLFPLLYNADNLTARIFFHRHRVYEWAHLWRQPRVHLVFIGFTNIARELILQYARIHPYCDHSSPLFTIICRQNAVLSFRQMQDNHDIFQYVDAFDSDNNDPQSPLALPPEDPFLNQGIHCGYVSCTVVPDERALLSEVLLRQVSELSPVTAVVACHEDTEKNFDRAVQVRNLSNRYNRWRVPVFVHAPLHIGLPKVLTQSATDANPARRVIPFGSPHDHCDVQLLERMDKWAEAIHEDYKALSVDTDPHASELPANRPWTMLSAEHRLANYRAADHIVVKLSDLGYRWYGHLPGRAFDGILASKVLLELDEVYLQLSKLKYESKDLMALDNAIAELEKLQALEEGHRNHEKEAGVQEEIRKLEDTPDFQEFCRLQDLLPNLPSHLDGVSEREHHSWSVERLVMGYKFRSVRDDRLLHHPKLVPWRQLLERNKAKDQRHLQVIRDVVPTQEVIPLNRGNRIYTKSMSDVIARMPLRVAIIGGYEFSPAQLDQCCKELQTCAFGRWLWTLVEDRWIELLSPLNTGAEIALTSEFTRRLKMPGCCCNKRVCPHLFRKGCDYCLLVPSNLPWQMQDERLREQWENGDCWYQTNFYYDPEQPGRSETHWALYKQFIAGRRAEVLAESAGRAEIVDLSEAGWTEAQLEEKPPQQAQAEIYKWIVERADVIISNDDQQARTLLDNDNLRFELVGNTSLCVFQKTPVDVLEARWRGETSVP